MFVAQLNINEEPGAATGDAKLRLHVIPSVFRDSIVVIGQSIANIGERECGNAVKCTVHFGLAFAAYLLQ